MDKYKHPEIVVHVPSFYGEGTSHEHKWKDRFNTSVATAATSLTSYLEWPGDKRGIDGWTRKETPDATELGPFAVYRIDEEATAKLRAEMATMDGSTRFGPPDPGRWTKVTNKEFTKKLREAIKRAIA